MKFKVGIIGDGHIAQRHKLVLAENKNFDLIAVADELKENPPKNLDGRPRLRRQAHRHKRSIESGPRKPPRSSSAC